MEDLLGHEAPNPKKLFDKKQYNTIYIKNEGFSNKQLEVAALLETLLEDNITREAKDEIFRQLKLAGDTTLMAEAVNTVERPGHKAVLLSACWECGLDFTGHFVFMVKQACSPDFAVAMEALTVLENCESDPGQDSLAQALMLARQSKHHPAISESLLALIQQKIT